MKLFEVLQPLFENRVDYIAKNQTKKIWDALVNDDTVGVSVYIYDLTSAKMEPIFGRIDEDYVYDNLIQTIERKIEDGEDYPDTPIVVSIHMDNGRGRFEKETTIPDIQGIVQEAVAYAVQFMADNISTKYLQWVVNRHIRGDFLLSEDAQVLSQSLEIYHQVKSELGIQLTNKVSTSDLFELIEPYRETANIETQRAREKELLANGEIEIPFSQDTNEIVIIPKTFEASYYLSEPNGWCTQQEGYFNSYTKDDRKLYYFRHEGKPYLVHWESNQFMKKGNKPFKKEEVYESSPAFQWIVKQKAEEVKGKAPNDVGTSTLKTLLSLGVISKKEVIDSSFSHKNADKYPTHLDIITSLAKEDDEMRQYFIKKLYSWALDEERDASIVIKTHLKVFGRKMINISLDIELLNKFIEQYGIQEINAHLGDDVQDFSFLIGLIIRNIQDHNAILGEELTNLLRSAIELTQIAGKGNSLKNIESKIFQKFDPKEVTDEVYNHIIENIVPKRDTGSVMSGSFRENHFVYRLLGFLSGREDFEYINDEFKYAHQAQAVVNTIAIHFGGNVRKAAFNSVVEELMDRLSEDKENVNKIVLLGYAFAVEEDGTYELKPLVDSLYKKVGKFEPETIVKIISALSGLGQISNTDHIGEFLAEYGVDSLEDIRKIIKRLAHKRHQNGGARLHHYAKSFADELYKGNEVSLSYLVSFLNTDDVIDITGLDQNQIGEKLQEEVTATTVDDKNIIVNLRYIMESEYLSDSFKVDMITEVVEWNPDLRGLEHIIIEAWQDNIIEDDDKAVYFAEEIAAADEFYAESLASVLFDVGAVDKEWFQQHLPEVYEENYGEEEDEDY